MRGPQEPRVNPRQTWGYISLDRRQRVTLIWAAVAVVITAFEGTVLVIAMPAVATEFHADTPALSDLGSVLAIGALGALPLSTLADRYGRKRLIAVGVAGSSLANFASGFAPSIAILAFLKLFAVCFEVLVAGVVTALIVEEAPTEHRGAAVSVIALLSGVGIFLVVVAYPLITPNWRWLFYAGGIGVLVAPLIWWLLPESKAWQSVHATRVTGSAMRLLMQPPWRRRVVILAAMTGLLAILLEPAGLLYTVYASFVLTVATAASTSLSFATGSAGFFIGNVLWSGFASANTPVFGAWSGELFPTRARATAEASIAVVAAIGSIDGLQIVAALASTTGLGGAIQLGGVAALAGAL